MNTGFKFLKEAGAKISDLLNGDGKTEDAVKNRIEQLQLDISNLNVDVDDEKVTLSGTAKSRDAREKAILAAGNVEGITEVIANIDVQDQQQSQQGQTQNNGPLGQNTQSVQVAGNYEPTFYQVKSGDTLSKIAEKFYGDASRYNEIFKANQPMLESADKIYPGQTLRIPNTGSQKNAA